MVLLKQIETYFWYALKNYYMYLLVENLEKIVIFYRENLARKVALEKVQK